ncbi:MAG: hypothetical protein K1X72_10490 [Pyrinomonadaceae bacterium]|nr:hypothetical protein [Pyrinomonadaceae bacterium]
MKNNINKLFGKLLAVAFLFAVFSIASYAQSASGKLYYVQGGAFYGTIYAYNGSHFEIYTNNTVIKTFTNSCSAVSSGGVAGVLCTFGQFSNGQHKYSGYGYFFKNGLVYLKWTNENMGAYWRNIDTGWYAFRP